MVDMQELIARLEAVEAGSRELDALVEVAVRGVEAARTGLAREHWAKWRVSRDFWVEDEHTAYPPSTATQSLDAALALAERVLAEPDIGGRTGRLHDFAQHFNGKWEAKTYRVSDGSSYQSVAATPALALCIAVLKAVNHAK